MFFKHLANSTEQRNWPIIGSICPVGRLRNRYCTFEFFHSSGITPLMTEKLKSVVREGAMTDAIHFSILAAIQSGPDALLVSKAC